MSANLVAPRPSTAAASSTIIVKVGFEGKEYTLHTELLKHHSGYFRGALSGAFKETVDGVVPFHDTDIASFEVFVDWIYTNRLPSCVKIGNPEGDHVPPHSVYVLADKLIVPKLKEKLMDRMFAATQIGHFSSRVYDYSVWDNLPENDPLLQLWADDYSVKILTEKMPSWFATSISGVPQNFLTRVMVNLNEMALDKGKKALKRETYSMRSST